MASLLEVVNLHAGYHDKEIVHGASFSVERGEFVCVIGANGCGKTTVLKNLLGLIKPFSGDVYVEGRNTHEMNEREMARHFAYIPQAHTPPFPFKVSDVVIMGRTPYVGRMAVVRPEDRIVAWRALKQMAIEHLADEDYTALSGGQQQLVLIARALTQQPDLLVMDEPTASLDFGNQQRVLARLRTLSQSKMGVLMVTHDPDHALFCADKVVVMQNGVVSRIGTPREVITDETLQAIYGTKVRVMDVDIGGGQCERVCIPLQDDGDEALDVREAKRDGEKARREADVSHSSANEDINEAVVCP